MWPGLRCSHLLAHREAGARVMPWCVSHFALVLTKLRSWHRQPICREAGTGRDGAGRGGALAGRPPPSGFGALAALLLGEEALELRAELVRGRHPGLGLVGHQALLQALLP